MNGICLFLPEGSFQQDKTCRLPLEIKETSQRNHSSGWGSIARSSGLCHLSSLNWLLSWWWLLTLWSRYIESIEVRIKIDNAISNIVVRPDITIHEFYLKGSSKGFVVTIDKKLKSIFEFRIGPSVFNNLSGSGLVGKFEDQVGVHRWESTCLVLNVSFYGSHLEHSKDSIFPGRLRNINTWTATTHYERLIKYITPINFYHLALQILRKTIKRVNIKKSNYSWNLPKLF